MNKLNDEQLTYLLSFVEDIRSRAKLSAVSARLREIVRSEEATLRDVKVRLRLNSPPVALLKRGAFNVLLHSFQVPAVLALVGHISVLELKKPLHDVEAVVVIQEIRVRGLGS